MSLGRLIKSRWVSALVMVWLILPYSHVASALTIKQMQALTGTKLLGLRVNTLFRDCGLPSAILDPTAASQNSHKIRWEDVKMTLSPMEWDLAYTRKQDIAVHESGWVNPHPEGIACLADLSDLTVYAKGDVGFLSVKKRTDNQGYRTSYRVPHNLYTAHQVIGISGRWKLGMPISILRKIFGNPDEVLDKGGGIKHYRYWVVVKNNKEMPVSVHAVDFEVTDTGKVCTRYSVKTDGFEFVLEKHDALMREWEKYYVLD